MRKFTTLAATIALATSGLVFNPAHATDTYNSGTGNGYVDCVTDGSVTGSGTIRILNNVVISNDGCTGEAPIPEGVDSIGTGAFQSSTITKISIPASVDDSCCSSGIATEAFVDATALKTFSVDGDNPTFFDGPNGELMAYSGYCNDECQDSSGYTLIAYPAANPDTTYTVLSGVTQIEGGAFAGATHLTSFALDPSIANYETVGGILFTSVMEEDQIERSLFAYPAGSTASSYIIPKDVVGLEAYAFADSHSLTAVSFAKYSKLESIGNFTFRSSAITSITIPATIKEIGADTFSQASGLNSITFTGWSGSLLDSQNNAVYLPAPESDGYLFEGWYSDADFANWVGGEGFFYRIQGPGATLYAKTMPIVSKKKKFVAKTLAKKAGVVIVSKKAKVTFKIAKASKSICAKSGTKLKTLKAGKCIVTFKVQEPKPKGGPKPSATKTVKTLVVQ